MARTIFFILITFVGLTSVSQTSSKKNPIDLCTKLVHIDSTAYKNNFVRHKPLTKTTKYKKVKGVITIKTADKEKVFKDVTSIPGYTNSVMGQDTNKHWVIITTDYEGAESDAVIVNTKTSEQWNLSGIPNFYGDKIICWQKPTDSFGEIHVLKINGDKIVAEKFFTFSNCDANFWGIEKMYCSGDTLFFQDEKKNFFKVKIDL